MTAMMSQSEYPPRSRSRSPPTYSRRKDTYISHQKDRYLHSLRRDHNPSYPSRSRSPSPRRYANPRRSRERSPAYHHRQRSYSHSPRRRENKEDRYHRSPSPHRSCRSPSPYSKRRRSYSRSRSRSPTRRPKEASKKSSGGGGGFKWKDPATTSSEPNGAEKKGMDRGYSSHYTHQHHQPARLTSPSPERDELAAKFGTGYSERYSNNRPSAKRPTTADTQDPGSVASKFGTETSTAAAGDADAGADDNEDERRRRRRKREKKEEKRKARQAAGPKPVDGPMIVVNVNDRLGTKVAVLCLPSDPIRLFKAQVAARVGRQPHEIMLKRQGERPFKDGLTLEDYGVSNGVQLDLEVDTGE